MLLGRSLQNPITYSWLKDQKQAERTILTLVSIRNRLSNANTGINQSSAIILGK